MSDRACSRVAVRGVVWVAAPLGRRRGHGGDITIEHDSKKCPLLFKPPPFDTLCRSLHSRNCALVDLSMVDAGGAFTTLEKTGTLLKLNKGAKTWAYSDVKPKTVHLHDGILTYSGGGSLGRTGGRGTTTVTVELCHVAQLRQSTVAGAPDVFQLQIIS